MKKECALCNSPAKMYCESDQASLCWSCDSKIHSANFLVAKHTRNLLCHVCQSPTPWTASGPKLGFTLSVCEICVANKYKKLLITRADLQEEEQVHASAEESSGGNEETEVDDTDSSEEEHDDDDDDDVESDENQVVPLSSSLAPPLRPTSTSSSVSEDSSSSSSSSSSSKMAVVSLKRIRQYADLNYQDDVCCTSSSSQEKNNNEEEATSLRPLKNQKREESFELETETSTSTSTSDVLVASLRKFHQQLLSGTGVPATNFGMCKSSSDNNHNNPIVR